MLNVTATQNGKLTDESKTCIEDFRKCLSDNRGGERERGGSCRAAAFVRICLLAAFTELYSIIACRGPSYFSTLRRCSQSNHIARGFVHPVVRVCWLMGWKSLCRRWIGKTRVVGLCHTTKGGQKKGEGSFERVQCTCVHSISSLFSFHTVRTPLSRKSVP
jgi:hypothetical protein